MEDKGSFILFSQYHGCWCPDDIRTQAINSHSTDLVISDYSGFTRRVQRLVGSCLHSYLLKLLKGDVHEAPRTQHLQQLLQQVPRDGLHQAQSTLDRVLRLTCLPQMSEDELQCRPDAVQFSGRKQVIEGEVLHQWVVINHCGQCLLQTWKHKGIQVYQVYRGINDGTATGYSYQKKLAVGLVLELFQVYVLSFTQWYDCPSTSEITQQNMASFFFIDLR